MLSIIIPTYNEEDYIDGVLSQFFTDEKKPILSIDHEIIVTDDGSTDRTKEISGTYPVTFMDHSVEHHLVKRFPHLIRSTIGANRNFGARHAKGDILLFIDAETRMYNIPDFFARAGESFTVDKNLVALTGTLWVMPELESWSDRAVYVVFNWIHRIKNNFLGMGEASGKFQMMRREAFEKVGGFREDLITREDADMFARLSKVGRTLCDPKLVVFYSGRRVHALGWPRLLSIWMKETLFVSIFGRALSTNWDRVDKKKEKLAKNKNNRRGID